VANLTSRNLLTPTSKSLITLNIGDNIRVKGEHYQFFGGEKSLVVIPTLQYESFKVNTYSNFKQDGLYRMNYFLGDIKFQWANQRVINSGLGFKFESEGYDPELQSALELKGTNNYSTTYAYLNINTLDRAVYPKNGIKLYGEYGFVFGQDPHLTYSSYGRAITSPDTTNINTSNYSRITFNTEFYHSLNERFTILSQLQAGINFSTGENEFNGFYIGGLNKMYRNQIVFAGLQDATLHAQNVAAAMLGLRAKIWNGVYLIAKSNILVNDFMKNRSISSNPRWVTGSSLTLAYNSIIGPIEFSTMYSKQSNSLQTYVNIGIPF
jgi:NTE family protein